MAWIDLLIEEEEEIDVEEDVGLESLMDKQETKVLKPYSFILLAFTDFNTLDC